MKITTPAQLTEFVEDVKKLNEARTQGEWACPPTFVDDLTHYRVELAETTGDYDDDKICGISSHKDKFADMRFIAKAPEMAEALIYAAQQLEAAREGWIWTDAMRLMDRNKNIKKDDAITSATRAVDSMLQYSGEQK